MTHYIYDARGSAVGFCRGEFIYALDGRAIGQLKGSRVYKLNGNYVGELDHHMVVDKHLGTLPSVGSPGNPGNASSPGMPTGRAAQNFGYRDVFGNLLA